MRLFVNYGDPLETTGFGVLHSLPLQKTSRLQFLENTQDLISSCLPEAGQVPMVYLPVIWHTHQVGPEPQGFPRESGVLHGFRTQDDKPLSPSLLDAHDHLLPLSSREADTLYGLLLLLLIRKNSKLEFSIEQVFRGDMENLRQFNRGVT